MSDCFLSAGAYLGNRTAKLHRSAYCGVVVMNDLLPVLWMTSCIPMTDRIWCDMCVLKLKFHGSSFLVASS